jgi:adenine phosphoribosyltransferase
MNSQITSLIRDIPDFPKPGILFKDITPLLEDAEGFKATIDLFADRYRDENISKIVGIEARGFVFGAPLAYQLGCGLGLIRKKGKLPYETISHTYDLEYGTDTVEMHIDTVEPGERVIVIDDLLATGGTMGAAVKLLKDAGAEIVEASFVVELGFLNGRDQFDCPIYSILSY